MSRSRGQRGPGSQFITTAEDEARIAAELKRRGMSRAELARLVDCTPSNLGRIIKKGHRSSFLPQVFKVLGLDQADQAAAIRARHARALAMLERLATSPDAYLEAIEALQAVLRKEEEIALRIAGLRERVVSRK